MVVGARNPEGVSYAQRISCHSPFSLPAIHRLANCLFTIQGSYSKISIR